MFRKSSILSYFYIFLHELTQACRFFSIEFRCKKHDKSSEMIQIIDNSCKIIDFDRKLGNLQNCIIRAIRPPGLRAVQRGRVPRGRPSGRVHPRRRQLRVRGGDVYGEGVLRLHGGYVRGPSVLRCWWQHRGDVCTDPPGGGQQGAPGRPRLRECSQAPQSTPF